jgi:hypothetical protein
MPKKRKQRRYSGTLNKPIVRPIGLLYGRDAIFLSRYLDSEWSSKFDLLMTHYGIGTQDPERWRLLAFNLALDHVPGMRVGRERPRKGAPRKWDVPRCRAYVALIDKIERERGQGIRDAIRSAKKRNLIKTGTLRVLENRYHDSKKRVRLADELAARPSPTLSELAEHLSGNKPE